MKKKINKDLGKLEVWLMRWRLLMVPSKCNYLVFSKTPKYESEKLCLKLLNQRMTINNNPTFLGIRFDHHLNFNKLKLY